MTRYFTKDHEWIDIDGEIGTIGISHYAQAQLGDITFVELPEVGRVFAKGDCAVVIDSVKAAADVYAPASGSVCAVNTTLVDAPERINSAAEQDGWLFRLKLVDAGDLADLMDEAAYQAYRAEL